MTNPSAPVRARIGRAEIWESLLRRREQASQGRGGMTVMEGGPGVGKSTFFQHVVADSHSARFRVFEAHASAHPNPPPFTLIRDAVATEGMPSTGRPTSSDGGNPSLAFLPLVGSEGGPSATSGSLRALADGIEPELASDRHRLSASLAEPLFSAATMSPTLLALEDLHRADPASLEFLQYLLTEIEQKPIWILVTLEPAAVLEAEAGSPLRSLLQRPNVGRLWLRPLSERELKEFIESLKLDRPIEDAEFRHLYAGTNGVPMFVEMLVRNPSAAVKPSPTDGASLEGADEKVRDADVATRSLLRLAAVIGDEFSVELLAAATSLDEEHVVERLELLVAGRVVRELESGRFAFTNEAFRYRVYSDMGSPARRIYHGHVAEALERLGARDIAAVYALARHTYLGQLDDKAIEYTRRAAGFAIATFQSAVAINYLEEALDALHRGRPNDTETEFQLCVDLASERAKIGEFALARRILQGVRASDRLWSTAKSSDRTLLTLTLGHVEAEQGLWDEAERTLAAVPIAEDLESPPALRLAALRLQGDVLYYRGRYAESLVAHEAARDVANQVGDSRGAAAQSIRIATALSMLPGRERESRPEFLAAVQQLVALGDQAEAAYGLLCLGAQLSREGLAEDARGAFQQATEMAEGAHDLRRLGWTHLNLSDLEFAEGRWREAEDACRQARSIFEQIGDALGVGRTALSEGRLALTRGSTAAAMSAFEMARAIFAKQNLTVDELEVDLREAEVDLLRRDATSARGRLNRLRAAGIERLRPDLAEDWQRLSRPFGHS